MPAYTTDTGPPAGRRQFVITGVLLVLGVVVANLPADHQQLIASALRSTVLRPFVLTQESVADVRIQAASGDELRARLDSMIAVLGTHYTLSEENRRLRSLLELNGRTGPAYRPATVVRSGTSGSESMFHLNMGYEDGVRENAPVLVRSGLLGVVRDIRPHAAIGMDWTHPEFRASAMTADGATYGIVETRRGQFREQDRLLFDGTPFHVRLEEGTPVVTSGLGGIFPRGVPLGTVEELAEAEGGWRKAYWLRPATHPGSATHVLVEVRGSGERSGDLSSVWPTDSILHERYVRPREPSRRRAGAAPDSAAVDTTAPGGALLARGAELFRSDSAGPSLVVRLDTTFREGSGPPGGAPPTEERATPAPTQPTPTPARPEPEARPPPRQQPQRDTGAQADTAGAAPREPVVRNLEAVIDSLRAADTTRAGDTTRRTRPDTNRTRPDTNRTRPDTNRVAGPGGGGAAATPPRALGPGDDGTRTAGPAARRSRGAMVPEAG